MTTFSIAHAYRCHIRRQGGKRENDMRSEACTIDPQGVSGLRAAADGGAPGWSRSGPQWGTLLADSPHRDASVSVAQAVPAVASAVSTGGCPQLVDLDVSAKDKHELFRIAADMLHRAHAVDPALILRALWRREEAGSTGLGLGVAIPHARVSGITAPLTMLLRMRVPILFDAPDNKPVSLALVIIVPADDATEQHLQLLARFAGLCTDRAFRTRLAQATDADDVRRAFACGVDVGNVAGSASQRRDQPV